MKVDVRDIYKDIDLYMDKEVTLQGWIRNHRKQKEFGFIAFYKCFPDSYTGDNLSNSCYNCIGSFWIDIFNPRWWC